MLFYRKLVIFTMIGLSISGILYFSGKISIATQDIQFYPSKVDNWAEIDNSIKLHGRYYYPLFFDASQKYPTVLMFHGRGRTLEDNDYFARKLAAMGILTLSISFRGHGQSEGYFDVSASNANITFGDALGAYHTAMNQSFIDTTRLIAHGTSMGGGISAYLALKNLVPTFIVWYPALGYVSGNTPLYQFESSNPEFKGLIIAGTADECGNCLPEYNHEFVENNPSVEIQWLEGATHTDSRFFLQCVDSSVAWISSFWNIPASNLIIDSYINGILGLVLATIIILIDAILYVVRKLVLNKEINS